MKIVRDKSLAIIGMTYFKVRSIRVNIPKKKKKRIMVRRLRKDNLIIISMITISRSPNKIWQIPIARLHYLKIVELVTKSKFMKLRVPSVQALVKAKKEDGPPGNLCDSVRKCKLSWIRKPSSIS